MVPAASPVARNICIDMPLQVALLLPGTFAGNMDALLCQRAQDILNSENIRLAATALAHSWDRVLYTEERNAQALAIQRFL